MIVVTRDAELFDSVCRELVGHCQNVRRLAGPLLAIGDIDLRGQPDLILLDPAAMEEAEPATIERLTQIAPESKLVWLKLDESNHAAYPGLAELQNLKLNEIADTFEQARTASEHHALRLSQNLTDMSVSQLTDDSLTDSTPESDNDFSSQAEPNSNIENELEQSDKTFDTILEPLGDTDLVLSVLQGGSQLTATAVSILRDQAGDPTAQFIRAGETVDTADHAQADVVFAGRRFGSLLSQQLDESALESWAGWLAHWLALRDYVSGLHNQALRDPLTGLYNRRHFDSTLPALLEQSRNERLNLTLLLFDIDNFKQYNDEFGHAAGDEILTECSRLLQGSIRTHDIAARIGGDEFAVIFWDNKQGPRKPNSQHPADVLNIAQRFQKAICHHHFPKLLEHAPGSLTISIGMATFPWDAGSAEQLIEVADQMLRNSKSQGKNCINVGPNAPCPLPENSD